MSQDQEGQQVDQWTESEGFLNGRNDERNPWIMPCELLQEDGMPHVRFVEEWRLASNVEIMEEYREEGFPTCDDFHPRWWPLPPLGGCD